MTEPTTLLNSKKYLALVNESEWNVFPGSPTYYHLPVDSYGVLFQPKSREGKRMVGLLQPKHLRSGVSGNVAGTLVCGLHGYKPTGVPTGKSLAQLMLEWGCADHESQTPPSKSAEWYEGPNVSNKRHTGLRVNQSTLVGNDDSGVFQLSLDLMGAREFGDSVVTSAQTLPNDREKLVDFEFPDHVFNLGGSAQRIGSISWQVQTGLQMKLVGGRYPYFIKKTFHREILTIGPVKEDDTWDDFRREVEAMVETDADLTIKGFHNGTGDVDTDYAQCVIDWPRLGLLSVSEEGGAEDIAMQPLSFLALKPDDSTNCSSMTWSDEAAA
jgi:hypothetical protein